MNCACKGRDRPPGRIWYRRSSLCIFQSLLLHHPPQQSNRRVLSPLWPSTRPSPFSQSLPPNWAPNPAGGSSSDGPVNRAADPCSGSWIVDEIRSSSGLLSSAAMSFGFNASANAMGGGAGGVNAGPDLETIQTEVGSSFFFLLHFSICVLYKLNTGRESITNTLFHRPSASYPSLVMPRFASHQLGRHYRPLHPRCSALPRREVSLLPLVLIS